MSIKEIAPGIAVAANSIHLSVKKFSLTEPFDVNTTLGYESELPNISFVGNVALDPSTQSLQLRASTFKADLSKIPWEHLKETVLPLKTVPFPEVLKGQVAILIKNLSAGPKGLAAVEADISLKQGEVSMKDVAPGISFAATHVHADVKDFAVGAPFTFTMALAYLHDEENINTRGTATLRLEDQSVVLKDMVVETDLSTFAMARLLAAITALQNVSLPEKLQGKFRMDIAEATTGPKGLISLMSKGSLDGGAVKLKELMVPIEGVNMAFSLTQKDFTMSAFQAKLGKGQMTAQGGLSEYLTNQNFTISAEWKGLDLSEILDQRQAQVQVEGFVSGSMKAQGSAVNVNAITGDGTFDVKEAKLKELNVLKTVLDKISFLPDVSSRVETNLPEKYKEKLHNKDTTINTITTTVKILEGKIVLDPISIGADEFMFFGTCQAGFDQKYVLSGSFKIPAELSWSMKEGLAELQYLYDKDNNISLPVHVSGQGAQAPVFSVTQTAIDMTKNAMRNEGKNQLEKVFNKVLGVEKSTSPSADGQPQDGTSPPEESPASTIINTIFDKILK